MSAHIVATATADANCVRTIIDCLVNEFGQEKASY